MLVALSLLSLIVLLGLYFFGGQKNAADLEAVTSTTTTVAATTTTEAPTTTPEPTTTAAPTTTVEPTTTPEATTPEPTTTPAPTTEATAMEPAAATEPDVTAPEVTEPPVAEGTEAQVTDPPVEVTDPPPAGGGELDASMYPTGTYNAGHANDLFALVNNWRAEHGQYTFVHDSYLQQIADFRAREIAYKFAHERPNGVQAPYWAVHTMGLPACGENLGYASEVIGAQRNFEGFQGSADHWELITAERYSKMAISVFVADDGQMYTVMLFTN